MYCTIQSYGRYYFQVWVIGVDEAPRRLLGGRFRDGMYRRQSLYTSTVGRARKKPMISRDEEEDRIVERIAASGGGIVYMGTIVASDVHRALAQRDIAIESLSAKERELVDAYFQEAGDIWEIEMIFADHPWSNDEASLRNELRARADRLAEVIQAVRSDTTELDRTFRQVVSDHESDAAAARRSTAVGRVRQQLQLS